jgi:hypothetical protein
MDFMYMAVVHQQIDLAGPWEGWRIRGRDLVSPGPEFQRISPTRLAGLLWRDAMELRLAGFASRKKAESERRNAQLVKVVVVQLSEYRADRITAAA